MKTKTVLALVGIVLPMVVAAGVRAAEDPPKTAADSINKALALLKAGDGAAAAKYFQYFPSRPGRDPAEDMKPFIDILKSGEISLAVADSREDGEPQYEGKPLSHWIAELKSVRGEREKAAALALIRTGSAAIPALEPACQNGARGLIKLRRCSGWGESTNTTPCQKREPEGVSAPNSKPVSPWRRPAG